MLSSATVPNLLRRVVWILALLTPGLWAVWLVALPENHACAAASVNAPTAQHRVYLPLVLRACASVELIQDGGFEAGLPNSAWQTSSNVGSDVLDDTPDPSPHSGTWKVWLGGDDLVQESLWQIINVPPGTVRLQVSYWWQVSTLESLHPFDTLRVQVRDANGNLLEELETLTDGDAAANWQQSVFTITVDAGQTIQLAFVAETDTTNPTNFFVDDVSVRRICP